MPRKAYVKRNPKQDALMLAELRKGETLDRACDRAAYTRQSVTIWRGKDPEYAEAIEDARAAGTAAMIAEARRRGMDGVNEPVFYKGEECGTVRRYSDSLLMFMIKQRDPSFRENFTVNGTVEHRHTHELVLRGANERAMRMASEARGLLPAPAEPGE